MFSTQHAYMIHISHYVMSHIIYDISCIICNTSHVTHHMSYIIHHISLSCIIHHRPYIVYHIISYVGMLQAIFAWLSVYQDSDIRICSRRFYNHFFLIIEHIWLHSYHANHWQTYFDTHTPWQYNIAMEHCLVS